MTMIDGPKFDPNKRNLALGRESNSEYNERRVLKMEA